MASEVLPVAHVDRDSARRLARGEPLLERCAFRRVAAFAATVNSTSAAGWVAAARSVLTYVWSVWSNPKLDRILGLTSNFFSFFRTFLTFVTFPSN